MSITSLYIHQNHLEIKNPHLNKNKTFIQQQLVFESCSVNWHLQMTEKYNHNSIKYRRRHDLLISSIALNNKSDGCRI